MTIKSQLGSLGTGGTNLSQTWTTPRFEDKTRTTLVRDMDKVLDHVDELRDQMRDALHRVALHEDLLNELAEAKVEKVGQLLKDRADHWKYLLEERFHSY